MIIVTAFHGTDRVFEDLKTNQEKRSAGTNGGLWFSSSPIVAASYTDFGGYNEKAYLKALENKIAGNSSIIKTKILFSNPLIFDAKFNESGDLENNWSNRITIADLFTKALKNGNDGVIVSNVDDCGSYVSSENKYSTIYGIVNENQILN